MHVGTHSLPTPLASTPCMHTHTHTHTLDVKLAIYYDQAKQ
jgi:hypothetical protein